MNDSRLLKTGECYIIHSYDVMKRDRKSIKCPVYCVTGCLAVTAPPQSTAAIFCYGVQITFCATVTVSFYCSVFYYSTT